MTQIDVRQRDPRAVPFRGDQPVDMREDLVVAGLWPSDERWWIPLGEDTWSRPLFFNVTEGEYLHLLRVTRAGLIARHRHTGSVTAQVLRGRWHYLEHDWVAEEGSFVFEPPGETHTLVVPEGCDEMATLFHVRGALIYVDVDGAAIGYDDVFTRIANARSHFARVGLPQSELDRLIR